MKKKNAVTMVLAVFLLGGCVSASLKHVKHESLQAPTIVKPDDWIFESVSVGKAPVNIVLGDHGRRLFATGNGDNTLTLIDTRSGKVIHTIDGGEFAAGLGGCPHNFCKGRGAAGAAIAPNGDIAYVSSMSKNAVSKIDLSTGDIVAEANVGQFPRQMAIAPDGHRLYVFNGVSNTISVIDTATMSSVGKPLTLLGGDASRMVWGRYLGMWLSPEGNRLFVFNANDGAIYRFDTDTLKRSGATRLGYDFQTLASSASGHRYVAIADKVGISIVNGETMAMQQRLNYCGRRRAPERPTMAVSPDGRYLALHGRGSPVIRIVDTHSAKVVRKFPSKRGIYVYDMTFSPGMSRLYLLGSKDTRGKVLTYNMDESLPLDNASWRTPAKLCTFFRPVSPSDHEQLASSGTARMR